MQKLKIVVTDILLALVLLTRLPLPHLSQHHFARQAAAVWAFPLAGLAVALPSMAIAGAGLWLGLPATVAAALSLAVAVILTGAMHEDGLADSADGLWGGFTVARRLEIMKDSHIGTYGVLALVLSIAIRWSLLSALFTQGALWAPLVLASLSRSSMPILMLSLPYARHDGLAQSVGRPNITSVSIGLGIGFVIALVCAGSVSWLLIAALCPVVLSLHTIAKTKIGGQTGDILGATQQLSEIACAIVLLAAL